MHQLLPDPLPDLDLALLGDRSSHPAPPRRPWVMANMVTSIDGAFAVDARSGGLGGAGDRAVFRQLRAAADAVLAAAGTARAESYRRPRTQPELLAQRRDLGLADDPRLVLVSRSLRLPADLPLLEGEGPTPLVLHPVDADTSGVPDGVELRGVGDHGVDLAAALEGLYDDGIRVLLCEGGPTLLGQLHRLDLIDELFVTVAPALVGGESVGLLGHGNELLRRRTLHRLLEDEGSLFCTYRRAD